MSLIKYGAIPGGGQGAIVMLSEQLGVLISAEEEAGPMTRAIFN